MSKIVVAGGPHTGKTTLIQHLQNEFGSVHFVPEPAQIIIEEELAKGKRDSEYRPIVPTERYPEFAELALKKSVELESKVPANSVAVLDRSIIDNLAYARLNNHEKIIPRIQRQIKLARYSVALFCEPVGTYTRTEVRPESEEFSMQIHNHLRTAYQESDVRIVSLPAVDIQDRVEIAKSVVLGCYND